MSTSRTCGTRCTHAALALYDANTCHQPVLAVLICAHTVSRCMIPTHTNARTRSTRVPHADLALYDADTYQQLVLRLIRYLSRANISYLWYSFARIQASRCMLLTHAITLVLAVLVYAHASLALYDADTFQRLVLALVHAPSCCTMRTHDISSYFRYSLALMQPSQCMMLTHADSSYLRSYLLPRAVRC